jgi:hypothetical protein
VELDFGQPTSGTMSFGSFHHRGEIPRGITCVLDNAIRGPAQDPMYDRFGFDRKGALALFRGHRVDLVVEELLHLASQPARHLGNCYYRGRTVLKHYHSGEIAHRDERPSIISLNQLAIILIFSQPAFRGWPKAFD